MTSILPTDNFISGLVSSIAIFVIFGIFAIAINIVIKIILRKSTRLKKQPLSLRLLSTINRPVITFLIILGVLAFLSILLRTEALNKVNLLYQNNDTILQVINKIWIVVLVAGATSLTAQMLTLISSWYIENLQNKTNVSIAARLIPPVRRIFPLLIYSAGFLIILDSLDISISPLLAGFGLGGLAVALAVQPTLSNFFAGTYLITEGELKKDDFIELEGGPSGFIVDVGWRSTKIQSRFNNLVIIPNSRLAQSIITNYSSPTPAINVRVTCGVSYESDLKQVEKIVLEIANDTIMDSPHAINENPPFFGFSEFGDSNIDFWVVIQASDRLGSFALKSTLIKNIHTRFSKEGIEINYPVRKLIGATSSPDTLEVAN